MDDEQKYLGTLQEKYQQYSQEELNTMEKPQIQHSGFIQKHTKVLRMTDDGLIDGVNVFDPEVARLAKEWFQVFLFGLPPYSISMMMWRFLSAQNIMHPQVIVGAVANLIVLPVCLEVCTAWFGFLGSAGQELL